MESFETTVSGDVEETEVAVRAALAEQGFGVLTEIDIAATFAQKLGIERRPLKILGACNPQYAHDALEVDPSVATLLPCNVVVEEVEAGTRVAIVDPRTLLTNPALADLADDAARKLRDVLAALAPR